MKDLRPIVFGKYCLLERISVGGMAEVYRARPFNAPAFRRFLAVKRILPNLAADEEFITMFVDEAKIAVQLNHRNICQIYELGRHDDSFYIVMEYIAGKDVLALQNWFRKRRKIMSVAQAAWVAAQVCDGLDYAHRKLDDNGEPLAIVHRDISPQNVIVAYDGEVKLIDFGIARAATTNQTTQVGVLKGKFGYMSPEQVDALPIDRRSDVFALGTLLWEMLTARRLFHGESDFATLEQVRNAPIEPPSTKNSLVPEALDRIVLKALERDREARYQWASELADDLRAFLAEASPDYSQGRLASWMMRNFPDEFADENHKITQYARFVTVEDVHAWYREHAGSDVRGPEVLDGASRAGGAPHDPDRPVDEVLAGNRIAGVDDSDSGSEARPADLGISVDGGDLSISVDPMAALAVPRPMDTSGLPAPRRRSRVGAWAAGLLVVAAAAAAAFGYHTWEAQNAPGSIAVEPMPSEGARVYVDGQPIAGDPPVEIDGLAPGPHAVEVRAEGYETVLATVHVAAGARAVHAPVLTPVTAAEGTVALTVSEPGAEVYLDGRLVAGQGVARTFATSAGERHVIEVRAPGTFVEELDFELSPGGRFARTVELRPVAGSITIGSQPAGDVYLEGELVGGTDETLVISELDVRLPYALEVRPRTPSFRSYSTTIVFDAYYDVRLHPLLPRMGTDAAEAPVQYGFLAADAGDADRWFRVLIDDRDTGLVTPIAPDAPLAVEAGERTISFVRADVRHDTVVIVAPGETVNVTVPAT